ncbi:VOC family protein [Pararhizobium sp. IMCC21322]|uniref:VOC family protein n=1 Tax=Pararhizobium sp. IMCC21322 TaxID=3067903 RepID=UPI00274108DB|nr:VOC family protein [Pararhizobium sp. IMCC21322]
MKFINPIPFVADLARAKAFYRDVLGLNILHDHGNFVQFDNGFVLHEGMSLHRIIYGHDTETGDTEAGDAETGDSKNARFYGRGNLVLYFEDDELDATFDRIADRLNVIHDIQQQAWGQRVFRFYDPDGHIVEVGEPQNPV